MKPVETPCFAIIGHPNEGKSSVVATLAENDQVRISAAPGETTECRLYPVLVDGVELIRFVDTPGFQHPTFLLKWMREYEGPAEDMLRTFLQEYSAEEDYHHDCELLRPLAEGAGVIYVVDGSRPIRKHDHTEMEILRLTGRPRMAIINNKEEEDAEDFIGDWKQAFSKSFNAYRVFNSHQAHYRERMALLESLKGIDQDWQPALGKVIKGFREDWERRNYQVAEEVVRLIERVMSHVESRNLQEEYRLEGAKEALEVAYRDRVAEMEQKSHGKVKALFKHTVLTYAIPSHSILSEGLFSQKTWQFLGLNPKQLVMAGAVAGAGGGVCLDLLAGGSTLGLAALLGAAAGAASVWWKGEKMARAEVKGVKLGGQQIRIGPSRNIQLMYVLLDRALLFYGFITHWSHARRECSLESRKALESRLGYSSKWRDEDRKKCDQFFEALRKKDSDRMDQARKSMILFLKGKLDEISGDEPLKQ